MIFLDTSIIIAALQAFDPRHDRAAKLLASATPLDTSIGDHSLAEIYSTLTGLPKPLKLSPRSAIRILDRVSEKVSFISLTGNEVYAAIQAAAANQVAGGTIYDALLVARARKVGATQIYTFNDRHFRFVAPDLASIIREP